jgi:branched-chain amino acid transport system substrate-binding protein
LIKEIVVQDLLQKKIGRRTFLGAAAAGLAVAGIAPQRVLGAEKTARIGFLAPLTGDVAAWGMPGLHGVEVWAEQVNAAGGVRVGEDNYLIEIVPFDNEYSPEKAFEGANKLIFEDGVKFIMMLGGDTWPAVQPIANRSNMLVSTLLPSDLSPNTPTLIAPCEVHPIYNLTGVWWLAENRPELKTAVICAQDDALGRPSVATYMAAFEAHGIDVLDVIIFGLDTTDFAPIMADMIGQGADIICLDTCYADYVHPLCEQAYQQGFKGQMISCTADFYEKIIEKTSQEFMEGFIFQFPDFDDPQLNREQTNFRDPNGFYAEYNQRWPGEWGAVSWEYASILDLWKAAAEQAGSVEPMQVLAAMKSDNTGAHAFGEANWWGKDMFGIDNALVGDWPVVVIENGKAVIKEYKNIPQWWEQHGHLLLKHFTNLGEMYHQKIGEVF